MTEQMKIKLVEAGINVSGAVERFMGNEALYYKFLIRFPEDPNYPALKQAIKAGECRKAFEAAHTLKGVAGNLSLQRLEAVLKELVEFLREGNLEQAAERMPDLEGEYAKVMAAICDAEERGQA